MSEDASSSITVKINTVDLLNCVIKTYQSLKAVLHEAKIAAQGSASEFVESGIGILMQAVEIYQNCFVALGIKTRKELELAWQDVYSDVTARDEVEELLCVEDEWNSFLKTLDEGLTWNTESDKMLVGSPGPYTCPVISIRTGALTTLTEFLHKGPLVLDEFLNYNSQIIIVTFGCIEGAKHWAEETGCQFEMLADEERAIYSGFGLTKSVFGVWNTTSMLYYAEQLAANKALPKKFGDYNDDIHQMGGDFVLNSDGVVVLAHLSHTPTDRPSVETLLQAVKDCNVQK